MQTMKAIKFLLNENRFAESLPITIDNGKIICYSYYRLVKTNLIFAEIQAYIFENWLVLTNQKGV